MLCSFFFQIWKLLIFDYNALDKRGKIFEDKIKTV